MVFAGDCVPVHPEVEGKQQLGRNSERYVKCIMVGEDIDMEEVKV